MTMYLIGLLLQTKMFSINFSKLGDFEQLIKSDVKSDYRLATEIEILV